MRFIFSVLLFCLSVLPLHGEIVIHRGEKQELSIIKKEAEEETLPRGKISATGYQYSRYYETGGQNDVISEVIRKASQQYDVDRRLVEAIVQVESRFHPFAVSRVGAMGLMQLMPDTARMLGVSNPFDIEENIFGGVRYFKLMYQRFNGNLRLALAAYNAGPSAVETYGGIPPYPETINYVEKVIRLFQESGGRGVSGTPLRVEKSSEGLVITNEIYKKEKR